MIREALQNTIGHFKDILNEKNKIVERHKMNLIETQQNMGRDAYKMVAKLNWAKESTPLTN